MLVPSTDSGIIVPHVEEPPRKKPKESFPSLKECFQMFDKLPADAKKVCCLELTLDQRDPLLTEDDVPGAKLDTSNLQTYTVDELKRWLATRHLNQSGIKKELIQR